ncbi:MAG: hypothetical protein NC394_07515 [Bacteroides sp.]|nr:hypothetical protein [Bacteroides sp.]
MKKFLALTVIISFISLLSACSVNKDTENESAPREEETTPAVSETETAAERSKAAEKTEEASEDIESTMPPDYYSSWQYAKSADPIETMRSAVENEANKSYTEYVEFIAAEIDEYGTEFYLNGIEEAGLNGEPINSKTDKTYDDVNIALVSAEYHVQYDGTSVFYPDGRLRHTFYLWQDKDTELWTVFDNMSPAPYEMEEWEGAVSKESTKNGEFLPSPLEWKPKYDGEIYKSAYWLYEPSDDPVEVVKSAIENQAQKDFTLAVSFGSAELDPEEAEAYSQRRRGSSLAQTLNISGELFDSGRIAAVYAEYHINYDNLGTYVSDGECGQYFYLWQDGETSEWHIFESSCNHTEKGYEIHWGAP